MNILQVLPELEGEEMVFVSELLKSCTEEQAHTFATVYRSRRKEPQTVLLLCLLGFIGIAGVQRFFINHIGMGLLFFFTGGFCLIGTIIDLVNYKRLSFEYNRKVAYETSIMVKGMSTSSTPSSNA